MMIARRGAVLLLGVAAPAFGQNTPPQTTQNTQAPQVIPGLGNFSLPRDPVPIPRATPAIVPTPTPTPVLTPSITPAPVATPAARATSRPTATSVPTLRPSPRPTPTPSPQAASPTPTPTIFAPPAATPSAVATPAPVAIPIAAPPPSSTPWLTIGGVAVLVLAAAGAVFYVRRRARRNVRAEPDAPYTAPPIPPKPAPSPAMPVPPKPAPSPSTPAPPQPAPAPPRSPSAQPAPSMLRPLPVATPAPTLEIALYPRRAGTNLTGAAVEYDIVVTNTGAALAAAVRLDARLTSAGAAQDATIAALFAEPVDRPLVAPFDLPPGGTVSLGGKAVLPSALLAPMQAGGRALFVPLMTINLRYTAPAGEAQAARAFMIGIARGEGARMAPFRLDQARMYDRVEARAYSAEVG